MVSSLCLSFPSVSVLLFYRPIPDFYANIPALYDKTPCYMFSTCSTAHGGRVGGGGGGARGYQGWCGGVPGLILIFNQAGGLTCQPDSQLRIPVRIPFLQGTGGSSS